MAPLFPEAPAVLSDCPVSHELLADMLTQARPPTQEAVMVPLLWRDDKSSGISVKFLMCDLGTWLAVHPSNDTVQDAVMHALKLQNANTVVSV